MDKKKSELSYKQSVIRLSKIIEIIETGTIDVDQLLELTDEAVHLIAFCKEKLTKTDQQIDKMLQKLNEPDAIINADTCSPEDISS